MSQTYRSIATFRSRSRKYPLTHTRRIRLRNWQQYVAFPPTSSRVSSTRINHHPLTEEDDFGASVLSPVTPSREKIALSEGEILLRKRRTVVLRSRKTRLRLADLRALSLLTEFAEFAQFKAGKRSSGSCSGIIFALNPHLIKGNSLSEVLRFP